jgi:hypothetical protein
MGRMSQTSTAAPVLGRPKIFTPAIAEHLGTLISQTGLSDSAAARQLGLSTSSLGRWKQQSPEFVLVLLHAREAFRLAQLDVILAASQAPGSGWRAAAWLLERFFPEDYHPNAAQRAKHEELAASRREEDLALAFPETEEPETEDAITPPNPSVAASQNSQNSRPSTLCLEPPLPDPARPSLTGTPSQTSQISPPSTQIVEPPFLHRASVPFTVTPSQNSQNTRPSILSTSILAAA